MSGPLLPDDVTQKEIELRETIRHILDARGSKSLTMTALYNMMTVEYARGVAEERARCAGVTQAMVNNAVNDVYGLMYLPYKAKRVAAHINAALAPITQEGM